jgi:hypothetical protein
MRWLYKSTYGNEKDDLLEEAPERAACPERSCRWFPMG